MEPNRLILEEHWQIVGFIGIKIRSKLDLGQATNQN